MNINGIVVALSAHAMHWLWDPKADLSGEQKNMLVIENFAEGQEGILVAAELRVAKAANQENAAVGARQRLNQNLLEACQRPVLMDVVAALWAGADPTCCSPEGLTPLHLCASRGHMDVAQLLIERGANPSSVCSRGKTPANLALEAGHQGLATMLIGAQERAAQSAGRLSAQRDERLQRNAQSALRLVQSSALRASFPRCKAAR